MSKESKMRKINGKTYSRMYGSESLVKPMEERLIFPHFDLDLEYIPEARNWKNGNTYKVTLNLKQTSIREDERGGSVGFDIVGVAAEKEPVSKGKADKGKVARRYDDSEKEVEDDD